MLALLALSLNAAVAGEYQQAAEDFMDLSFDLDEVEGKLRAQKRAVAAPAAARPAAGYAPTAYVPPPMLPLEPNSKLDAVVVYRDRALVTRLREVSVPAGVSSVSFEGLPLGLATDTLHAQARDAGFKVVGVELVSGAGKVDETERIQTIRDQAEGLTEELGQVRDRVESLLAQRAYLRGALTGGGDKATPTVAQMKETFAYVGDAERDLAARLRAEQEKAKDLDEKLSPLLIKLDNPLATGMTVRVDIESERAQAVDLALQYQVVGARWWPAYNTRLDEATGQVELEYDGMIAQATGEEWKDAQIYLSTADASLGGSLPVLAPWYLGRDGYGFDASALQEGRGYYEDGAYAASVEKPAAALATTMSANVQGSGAVVFAIPGRRTVRGDGSEQRVPIGRQRFQAEIERATVPKQIPEVFRSARFTYGGEAPLLPGPVSAFVGSDYVGSAQFGATIPGESLSVGFATDPTFKVTRTLVSRKQEFLGAGKKTARYTFEFRIDVQNFGKAERTVLVSDQFPVSEVEKVLVEVLPGTAPLPSEPTDPAGVAKWRLTLAPGQTQSITLAFSVTAPREVPMYALEQML